MFELQFKTQRPDNFAIRSIAIWRWRYIYTHTHSRARYLFTATCACRHAAVTWLLQLFIVADTVKYQRTGEIPTNLLESFLEHFSVTLILHRHVEDRIFTCVTK